MISKAALSIEKYSMLKNTNKVFVGFSGGADSTALLHFLYFFASDKGKKFTVEAVHINHCLRGEESVRDENFVKSFCSEIGVKLHLKRIDVKDVAQKNKIGLEEAGRMVRYEIFESLVENENDKIATAHTLSDSCETFIFNLIRGSSLKGLCGIPPVRGKIIRPLIDVTRKEIEQYCKENELKYIQDSTNFEREYTRNKIRLDVIPILKKINPNLEKSVSRTLSLISEDEKYIEEQTEKALDSIKLDQGYDAEKLKKFSYCLKSRLIIEIVKESMNKIPEKKHVDLICKIVDYGGTLSLSKNKFLVCKNGLLEIVENKSKNSVQWEYTLKNVNNLTETKTNIIIKTIPFSEYKNLLEKPEKSNVIDSKKLPPECIIRNRRAGDKFTLPFRKVTKTVKKLMNEFKIPEKSRNKLAIIACGKEVVWIDGIGVSEKYRVDKHTEEVAIIYKKEIE